MVTPVTRIFGSPLSPGKLHFYDAEQTSPEFLYASRDRDEEQGAKKYIGLQTSLFTQVRIDRLTGTAAYDALYTSEFGIRDLVFQGKIDGWLECTSVKMESLPDAENDKTTSTGTPTYSLLLLLAGLQLIERIGANKSAGKGQCVCEITQVSLNKQICTREQWQSWLKHLDVLLVNYA